MQPSSGTSSAALFWNLEIQLASLKVISTFFGICLELKFWAVVVERTPNILEPLLESVLFTQPEEIGPPS
jgi:hypothetical protein